jgi:uncharacterized membrane protein YbhN (UPF0104 family)
MHTPMSDVAHPLPVLPFHDPSRRSRLVKFGAWLVGIALLVVVLHLLGVDVVGWLEDLWDQIRDIPAGYLVAALVFQTARRSLLGSRTTASCAPRTLASSPSGRS